MLQHLQIQPIWLLGAVCPWGLFKVHSVTAHLSMHQDDNTLGIFSWVMVPTHAVAANLVETYTPTGSQELLSRLLV